MQRQHCNELILLFHNDSQRAGQSSARSGGGVEIFCTCPDQSCMMGAGPSFWRRKWLGHGVDHPPQYNAEVKDG